MGIKLEKVKQINRKLALAIIAVLLVSSSLVLLNSVEPVLAQSQSELLADDMYGWPVGPGHDSGNTWFNPGPAPNKPDILWSTRRPDTGGSLSTEPLVAFDGKLFIHGGGGFFGGGAATLYALDPFTGSMIWSTPLTYGAPRGFGTSTYWKVADGYIGYETSDDIVVLRTSDGSLVGHYEKDDDLYTNHGGGSVVYWGGFYSSFDNLKLTTARSNPVGDGGSYPGDTPVHLAVAYDLSDPENPTLAWTWKAPTGIEALCSAPGLAFFGGYGEGEIYAINATTGELVWKQWKKGNAGYAANYWDGKLYHSASSTAITCYNAYTGEIIFEQDEGGRAFFVFGDAIAYGKYIGKNIALPDGYVGAWDAYTGEPLWRFRALYNIAYLTPVVADGKLYCQRYDGTAGGVAIEEDSFCCWDVFTGQLIWEMHEFDVDTPVVAYGNLYCLAGGTLYCIGESDKAHSTFHGGDDIENPGIRVGQSGPTDISEPTWTFDSGGAITGSAVAGDGKVYFGSLNENVYCVDAFTGEEIWKFPLGYRMSSTPALAGNRLYIGPDDGSIYCLDADDGEQIWKTSAGGKTEVFWISAWQPRSSPIVVGNRLYVGSLDGNLYCVDTTTGAVVWTAETGGARRPTGGTPLVVPDLGMVYISASDSFLYAFDLDDGTEVWNTQLQPTSGFDDRAMISTPIWDSDDDTLWICADTFVLCRINATTGERLNHMGLPYSDGGTMTPAISTPAIQRIGNDKYLYVGDGFQIDCFDIGNIIDDPDIWVSSATVQSAFFFGSSYVYARYIDGERVNSTTANNVNLEAGQGNETHLPIVWERWLGHQVYSSPVIADQAEEHDDKVYFGDDVYSITVINATDGQTLSAYNTQGQVFSSACLYAGWLYMGSQDGIMYAFGPDKAVAPFTISAASNKGASMWNNETLVIEGRLLPTVTIDPLTGFGTYETNGYAGGTVKLSLTTPAGSDVSMETTTDDDGYFSFSYSPTEVGDWGWVVYYEGEMKSTTLEYSEAYGDWNPFAVVDSTPPAPPPPPPPPPPPEEGIPFEYIYVAVAVIVIVIVALVAYFLLKK
jgi:outer membrane protein assembly factor BamB